MGNPAADWIQYWDSQSVMDDDAWRKNTQLLLEGSGSFFAIAPDDTVLDIGSGPGFLADALRDRVRSIHCVDTSPRYVNEGRARLAGVGNVKFTQLGADYLDFSFLGQERFSKVICASVIQYYRNIAEVERLLANLRQIARPGALLLIADIPLGGNLLYDLAGLVRTAWRKQYLLKVLGFTLRSLWGNYARLRKRQGLLHVRKEEMQRMLDKLHLRAEWISTPLTLNDTRKHLLIRF